ncbi:MAG: OmpA family protein, partial [Saprospiraceae bacterium]
KSVFVKGKWGKPLNLGPPLNTEDDDIYFVVEANGTVGYYASRKADGYGDADIYKVAFVPTKVQKKYLAKLTLFKGKVIDKTTARPLEAEIEITDLSNNTVIARTKSNSATGKFLISLPFGINYGISVSKEGYLFFSDNINITEDDTYKEVVKTIPLEKIKKGNTILLHNIFYDFDQATLRRESHSELDQLTGILKDHPEMKIEISSHTDSKGTEAYNLHLSQARAQAVVDYLIAGGIDRERLIARGYGETRPIAPNQNPDGSDNPEGRQTNRRTEFTILEMHAGESRR